MDKPPQTLGWIPTPGYARGQRWELRLKGVTGRVTYVGRVWHNCHGKIEASTHVPEYRALQGRFETLHQGAKAIERSWRAYLRKVRPVRRVWKKAEKEERRGRCG
jgi:hypothetical protein